MFDLPVFIEIGGGPDVFGACCALEQCKRGDERAGDRDEWRERGKFERRARGDGIAQRVVAEMAAALAEANHDDAGLAWPAHVAPAHVHVVATGKDASVFEEAERLATELAGRGVEVIYDDRPKVSPGVKFKDAELIGVPTIVVVGKGLADGVVEVKDRATGERTEVAIADLVATLTA